MTYVCKWHVNHLHILMTCVCKWHMNHLQLKLREQSAEIQEQLPLRLRIFSKFPWVQQHFFWNTSSVKFLLHTEVRSLHSAKSLGKVPSVSSPRLGEVFAKSFLGWSSLRVLFGEIAWRSGWSWQYGTSD